MLINSIFFIVYSTILIFAAILTMVSNKIIHSLIWAMLVFLMVGCLFLLLGATYNAVVQFLIYVVAIPILIGVSIMLVKSNIGKRKIMINSFWKILAIIAFVLFIGEFLAANSDVFNTIQSCVVNINSYSDLESFSKNIFSSYPILLLEFGLGIVLTVVGMSYYER